MSNLDYFNIQKHRKLEDLADVLVPSTFKTDAPQFLELIKAFLVNVEQVQESANQSFLDTIDPDKIKSNDIMRMYFNTYLKTLNIEPTENFIASRDILKVSKEIVMKKGTPFIYNILINLLVYIFPNIGNQYQEYLLKLEDPNLTDEERLFYEENITFLEAEGLDESKVIVTETENLFEYEVRADIDDILFNTYIKPFCHPAGWHVTFFRTFYVLVQDEFNISGTFMIFEIITLPLTPADGKELADADNDNSYYPNKYLVEHLNFIEILRLLPDGTYEASGEKLADGNKDSDDVMIDYCNNTDYILGRKLGDATVYDDIISSMSSPDMLFIYDGNTYYKEVFICDETIINDINDISYRSTSPSGKLPLIAGNSYPADGTIKANYAMLASDGTEIVQTYYIDGED